MVETLEQWDKALFFAINARHNAFFDFVFYWVSNPWVWVPVYAFIFYSLVRLYDFKTAFMQLALVGAVVALADFVSVYTLKEVICRYRPTHNCEFGSQVHVVNDYKGGIFGFVSSHAVNFMTWTLMVFWFFRQKTRSKWIYVLFFLPLFVGYSRIYLGVHYPGDIAGGFLLGTTMALAGIFFWKKVIDGLIKKNSEP